MRGGRAATSTLARCGCCTRTRGCRVPSPSSAACGRAASRPRRSACAPASWTRRASGAHRVGCRVRQTGCPAGCAAGRCSTWLRAPRQVGPDVMACAFCVQPLSSVWDPWQWQGDRSDALLSSCAASRPVQADWRPPGNPHRATLTAQDLHARCRLGPRAAGGRVRGGRLVHRGRQRRPGARRGARRRRLAEGARRDAAHGRPPARARRNASNAVQRCSGAARAPGRPEVLMCRVLLECTSASPTSSAKSCRGVGKDRVGYPTLCG